MLQDEVTHGYQLLLPIRCIKDIPDACIGPIGLAHQESINERGEIVPKNRMTHDQSWTFDRSRYDNNLAGLSVNERVVDSELTPCKCGHALVRFLHTLVLLRSTHPTEKIFIAKFDWKTACRRAHNSACAAARSIIVFAGFALMALRLTFGGKPNPSKWSDISESVTDVANDLMRCKEWDPSSLHSPHQHLVGSPTSSPSDIPIQPALPVFCTFI